MSKHYNTVKRALLTREEKRLSYAFNFKHPKSKKAYLKALKDFEIEISNKIEFLGYDLKSDKELYLFENNNYGFYFIAFESEVLTFNFKNKHEDFENLISLHFDDFVQETRLI